MSGDLSLAGVAVRHANDDLFARYHQTVKWELVLALEVGEIMLCPPAFYAFLRTHFKHPMPEGECACFLQKRCLELCWVLQDSGRSKEEEDIARATAASFEDERVSPMPTHHLHISSPQKHSPLLQYSKFYES